MNANECADSYRMKEMYELASGSIIVVNEKLARWATSHTIIKFRSCLCSNWYRKIVIIGYSNLLSSKSRIVALVALVALGGVVSKS